MKFCHSNSFQLDRTSWSWNIETNAKSRIKPLIIIFRKILVKIWETEWKMKAFSGWKRTLHIEWNLQFPFHERKCLLKYIYSHESIFETLSFFVVTSSNNIRLPFHLKSKQITISSIVRGFFECTRNYPKYIAILYITYLYSWRWWVMPYEQTDFRCVFNKCSHGFMMGGFLHVLFIYTKNSVTDTKICFGCFTCWVNLQ